MQTLKSIVQEVIAGVEGGVFTDETKFEEGYIQEIVHQARALLLKTQHPISQLWTNEYHPPYSEDLQENDFCEIKIAIPTPIIFDNQGEGLLYLGGKDGRSPFKRIGYLGDESIEYAHPITTPRKGRISFSISAKDKDFFVAKIYGNVTLENILVRVVAYDPTKLPSFREDKDLYPISGELLTELKSILIRLLSPEANTPPDVLGNTSGELNDVYRALNAFKKRQ